MNNNKSFEYLIVFVVTAIAIIYGVHLSTGLSVEIICGIITIFGIIILIASAFYSVIKDIYESRKT